LRTASPRRRPIKQRGVIACEGGRSSIPETVVIEPMGRGVLDRPVESGDDGGGRDKASPSRSRSTYDSDNANFLANAPHRHQGVGSAVNDMAL
jgi:hypothetical protein